MTTRKRFVSKLLLLAVLVLLPAGILTAGGKSAVITPQKLDLQRFSLEDQQIIPAVPLGPPATDGADGIASITNLYTFDGEASNNNFGFSASGAGDVNNDGYDDVIVGAPFHDGPAGTHAGRAYVFSGLDGGMLWTFDGENIGNTFGYSVSGAGDVNNDGYADLIVGAIYYNGSAGSGAGRVYIFSGLNGNTLRTFDGEATSDHFGTSVSGAGDVNNDGYDDVIVGAIFHSGPAGAYSGKAYVYSGQTGLVLWTFDGEAAADRFGISVSGAGDVNNDGYADLIVGACYHDGSGYENGKAYIYSGENGALLASFVGEEPLDSFGRSVAGVGDMNNDGYADVVVGAEGYDGPGGSDAGKAYVYSGQTWNLLWSFDGEAADDNFGRSVSGAGDVNGDGYPDLIIGAPMHNGPSGLAAGRGYVYSGRTGNLLWVFDGETSGDNFGISVSGAGDVDNDGRTDLIVGASNHDGPAGEAAGKAYVFSGRGIGCRTVSPVPVDLEVARETDIDAVFNIDIDGATITSSSIFISGNQTGVHPGALNYNSPSLTMLFNPTNDFVPGEVVTCVMTDALTTTSGFTLEPCAWQFTTEATSGSGAFDAHADLAMGDGPQWVVAADFDNDGDIDLATTNYNGGNISVRLNNGDGTFAAAASYWAQAANPTCTAAADFDGDGDIDFATMGSSENRLAWLLNDGDGTFTNNGYIGTGNTPRAIVAADFNADGAMDYAYANSGDDNITVGLNTGYPVFAESNYGVKDQPNSIAAGDLDGDGDIDLVTANPGVDEAITIRWNDGSGGFPSGVWFAVGNDPINVRAADFDGDGDLDLALTRNSASSLGVAVNGGGGVYTSLYTFPVGVWPHSVAAPDLDHDGDLDLVCSNAGPDYVSVFLFDVFPAYSYATYPVGGGPLEIVSADVNGDGALDVITANVDTDNISVLMNIVPPCYCGNPGDVNNDGGPPNPLDVTYLVQKVFKSQDALYDYSGLDDCPYQNGDVNGDGGTCNPLDVTYLVQKVFKSQDALCVDRCNGTPGSCPGP